MQPESDAPFVRLRTSEWLARKQKAYAGKRIRHNVPEDTLTSRNEPSYVHPPVMGTAALGDRNSSRPPSPEPSALKRRIVIGDRSDGNLHRVHPRSAGLVPSAHVTTSHAGASRTATAHVTAGPHDGASARVSGAAIPEAGAGFDGPSPRRRMHRPHALQDCTALETQRRLPVAGGAADGRDSARPAEIPGEMASCLSGALSRKGHSLRAPLRDVLGAGNVPTHALLGNGNVPIHAPSGDGRDASKAEGVGGGERLGAGGVAGEILGGIIAHGVSGTGWLGSRERDAEGGGQCEEAAEMVEERGNERAVGKKEHGGQDRIDEEEDVAVVLSLDDMAGDVVMGEASDAGQGEEGEVGEVQSAERDGGERGEGARSGLVRQMGQKGSRGDMVSEKGQGKEVEGGKEDEGEGNGETERQGGGKREGEGGDVRKGGLEWKTERAGICAVSCSPER